MKEEEEQAVVRDVEGEERQKAAEVEERAKEEPFLGGRNGHEPEEKEEQEDGERMGEERRMKEKVECIWEI